MATPLIIAQLINIVYIWNCIFSNCTTFIWGKKKYIYCLYDSGCDKINQDWKKNPINSESYQTIKNLIQLKFKKIINHKLATSKFITI